MTAPTRSSLLLALRDPNDHRAWIDFVDLYTPLVFEQCVRRGLQDADAEDVTQEVMRAVAGAMQKFTYDPARGRFRSWLQTVTRSKLADFFAHRDRRFVPAGDSTFHALPDSPGGGGTDAVWEESFRRRLFEVAAARVQEEFQDRTWKAFWRTSVDNVKATVVAVELGMTVGAIYIARSRVLARLRAEIERLSEGTSTEPAAG